MKKYKRIEIINRLVMFLIITILMTGLTLSINTKPASAAVSVWESYTTGGAADSDDIYGANWFSQTFTVGTGVPAGVSNQSHSITSIKFNAMRTLLPGLVTLALYQTTAGSPSGAPIASATLNGNIWNATGYALVEFVFTTPVAVNASTMYGIVVYAISGDATNFINIELNAAGTYAGGNILDSTNSGLTWSATAGSDSMFQIFGDYLMQIVSAAVFSNYAVDTNDAHTIVDTLIVANIINTYTPYYPNQIPSQYFSLQLLDLTGTIVLASNPISGWGDGVSSIYIGISQTAQLQNKGAYILRLLGNFAGAPTSIVYTLQPNDWKGTNLALLDQWCITTAINMGTYYSSSGTNTTFVTQVQAPKTLGFLPSGSSMVLNTAGGAIFENGIFGLSDIRPNLFQTLIGQIKYKAAGFNNSYQTGDPIIDNARWQANVGPTITADATTMATIFQVDAKDMLVFFWIIIYALFAFWLINANQLAIASLGGVPWMMWGVYLGVIDVIVIGTIASLSALYIVWYFWWTRVV